MYGYLLYIHMCDGECSGEEVSVSLVYALGLRIDQTPPIRASKSNTTGKAKTKWVPKKANLGKTGAMTGPK
jgi:hypothetical protein